ncbi:unnamed protein product [Brassicogethes aeneus]|uniref:N-acetyltransferase domain-containing protein n=1 Tax=Brassicogethes aeneus TaxID=1431903 RepID=A0A9P0FF50_BRAAE|nr:unnamed protein product [Brassicogethes aeneus]
MAIFKTIKMTLKLLPLHKNAEYMLECCKLINEEWKRSETARLRSLEGSCDKLPTCLILLEDKKVIGHVKLSVIGSIKEACFLETVVISKDLRGKGFGSVLMKKTEEYCREFLKLKTIFLSTKGQEGFYRKLGYSDCKPVSIYGGGTNLAENIPNIEPSENIILHSGPPPPPIPSHLKIMSNPKTFMKKDL